VSRGATFAFLCLLVVFTGAVNTEHRLRSKVPPVEFKQQAKDEVTTEAAVETQLARSQFQLEQETKMLDMQREQMDLLLKLKATMEARERAESTLTHQRLVMAQREVSSLVEDLASTSKNKMLIDLQKLNSVISHSMLRHHKTTTTNAKDGAQPALNPIDTKLTEQKKQTPAATTSSTNAATPSNGVESDAKIALHKQIVAKATEVIDAQLDGILNSQELAYIKAHNDLGDTDQSQSQDGTITEIDSGANPGESPDDHYNRLTKEADALMASAYPFIKCEGGAATGESSGGSGSHSSGTGSTLESSTGASNSTSAASGASGGSGGSGATGTGTAASGATGTGLLEAGATAGSGAAAAGGSGAAAAGATGAVGSSSSSS